MRDAAGEAAGWDEWWDGVGSGVRAAVGVHLLPARGLGGQVGAAHYVGGDDRLEVDVESVARRHQVVIVDRLNERLDLQGKGRSVVGARDGEEREGARGELQAEGARLALISRRGRGKAAAGSQRPQRPQSAISEHANAQPSNCARAPPACGGFGAMQRQHDAPAPLNASATHTTHPHHAQKQSAWRRP